MLHFIQCQRRQNHSMWWIHVLCDEYSFYNFQIPHRILVYHVTVIKVTEKIKVDAKMTNSQLLLH